MKRNPQGFDLLRELKKPTAALRAWVQGSPRRGLSPGETVLVTAREQVVASEPGGGHYLPGSLLRRPQGPEVARWFVALVQVADDPERPGEKKGAAARAPAPTVEERRAFVEECLIELRPRLVADLRDRILPHAFPPGTAEMSFEVFEEALEELSILGYPLDADGEPVQVADRQGRRVDAPYLTVLPEREVVPARLRKQFARLAGVRFDHTPLVVQWFIAGWREAGGERFPLRARVGAHDDARGNELPTAAR